MAEASVKGKRCRARIEIRNYAGTINAASEGTVEYQVDNLGRRLIQVQWDNGLSMMVFPHEIEILDTDP